MRPTHSRPLAVAAALVGAGVLAPAAFGSPPSGDINAPVLVTANLDQRVNLHSDGVKLQTHGASDVRVQQFVFGPGSATGWHHHPGVVVIAIQSGSLTFWDSDCQATTYGPGLPNGSVFFEGGDEPGQVTSANGAT
jgi:quercetin dioxygenase-like cupin family protein